jgi:excisionase family DNA binding protein
MYLTMKDVAAYMKVGRGMIYKLRSQGLPCVKLGKRVLFRQEDVDAFMQSHLVSPILPPPKAKKRR